MVEITLIQRLKREKMVEFTLIFTFYQRLSSTLNQRDFNGHINDFSTICQPQINVVSTKMAFEINVVSTMIQRNFFTWD